jgi:hypothetical protein
MSRKSAPVAIGGGLVAVSVIAGSCVVALSGGPGSVSDASGLPAAHGRAGASTRSGADWAADLGGSKPGATADSLPFPVPLASQTAGGKTPVTSTQNAGSLPPRLVVPDVIASAPGGVTSADLAKLRRIGQVRSVLPVAGARISVNGKPLTVVGAPAAELRPWMPPDTAANASLWSAFAKGDLITTTAAAKAGRLSAGTAYDVSAAVRTQVTFGTSALLGIAGVDGVVSTGQAKRLGLVRNVAVLINAPAANMSTLVSQVRAALGARSQVIRLVPVTVSTKLPVDTSAPTGTPTSYMSLYQESAAQYCPGLSWTVLAAIGQIESADGTNDGPSSAGALGPMQFLPSTWKTWGITAFGQTGAPNIMNPFDAVPSAARMLCADGAGSGGQDLRQAIFDYNHAGWYVDEVLTLANEYGSEFG